MEEEKISVVVPVFNVQKYLTKCINSIINQTYKNTEIILVDDGSTDESGEICDQYVKKDNRITVIHKENGGLSDARNCGIDESTGNYIMFIDSDDYVEDTMIEKLYDDMKKNNSDISICNFFIESEERKEVKKTSRMNFCVTGNEKFKLLYNEYCIPTIVAWNKLYRRELFNKIRYTKGKLNEDEFIICDLLKRAQIVSYTMEPLYHYIQRSGSIMKTFDFKKFEVIDVYEDRDHFFRKIGAYELIVENQKMEYRKIETLIIEGLEHNSIKDTRIRNAITKLQSLGTLIKNNASFKFKLRVLAIKISPKIYFNLRKYIKNTIGREKNEKSC